MRDWSKDAMSKWPDSNSNALQSGVPSSARHMLIHGLHLYEDKEQIGCPQSVVAAVQFIAEGGGTLENYEFVPMTNPELVNAILTQFNAKTRCVFVNISFYNALSNSAGVKRITEPTQRSTEINK